MPNTCWPAPFASLVAWRFGLKHITAYIRSFAAHIFVMHWLSLLTGGTNGGTIRRFMTPDF